MTDTQKPEALQHAERLALGYPLCEESQAAAEFILRLHAENEALRKALCNLFSYANRLEMNDADADGEHPAMQEARAAMKGQP